jgi:hypothetical protein
MVKENPNRSTKSIKAEIAKMTGKNLDGRVVGGERRKLVYQQGKAATYNDAA